MSKTLPIETPSIFDFFLPSPVGTKCYYRWPLINRVCPVLVVLHVWVFFLRAGTKSHKAFMYNCPPKSPQTQSKVSTSLWVRGRPSEAVSSPRGPGTGQGCGLPCVSMGWWGKVPGLGQEAGLKQGNMHRGQGWHCAGRPEPLINPYPPTWCFTRRGLRQTPFHGGAPAPPPSRS